MHTQGSSRAAMTLLSWQCTHASHSCYGWGTLVAFQRQWQ